MSRAAATRPGAALAGAIVVLLIIDCIALGALHLALSEARLAAGVRTVLEVRLAAESAAHEMIAQWGPALDSLPVGGVLRDSDATGHGGMTTSAAAQRVGPGLYLVRADARAQPPRSAHAAAALLAAPPLLDSRYPPDQAALTAAAVELAAGGSVSATSDACHTRDGSAIALTTAAVPAGDGSILGPVHAVEAGATPLGDLPRILAAAGAAAPLNGDSDPSLVVRVGPAVLDEPFAGVLVVDGDLAVAAPVRGLLLVAGAVVVEADGSARGAVHVRGPALVRGALVLDACAVADAVQAARARAPRLLRHRPAIPAF